MSSYSIDFSEPLRVGFEIPAGGYNGPGGTASTSLRLHGRGALEWGEGVNEDLVRLTENFASASPPPAPIAGQMWVELKLYRKGPTVWYRYNLGTSVWEVVTVATSSAIDPDPLYTPAAGTYHFNTATQTLWGFYEESTVGTNTYAWRKRSFTSQTTDAVPTEKPEQTVKVYNAFAVAESDRWTPPQSVTVAPSTTPPATPVTGTMWFNTTDGVLYVYDASLLPGNPWRSLATGGSASTGNLDMGAYSITNVADAVNPTDALNLQTGNSLYVNITGDTLTGPIDMGTNKITNLGAPTALTDAATKQYVDTAIAGATSGDTAGVFNNPAGSITYNAGDIAIAGGKIYIALTGGTSAVPGGEWKQVWPATYS